MRMKNEMPELNQKIVSALAAVAHEDISLNGHPAGQFVEIIMQPAMEDLGGGKKDLRQAIQITAAGKTIPVGRNTGPEKISAYLETQFAVIGNRRVWVSRKFSVCK